MASSSSSNLLAVPEDQPPMSVQVTPQSSMIPSAIPKNSGSGIPRKKKPMAVVMATKATENMAAKLKRRSVNALRGQASQQQVSVVPKSRILLPAAPVGRPQIGMKAERVAFRNTANTGSAAGASNQGIQRPGRFNAQPTARRGASKPVSVKLSAVKAMERKKPSPFVSRREKLLQRQLSVAENEKQQFSAELDNIRQEHSGCQMRQSELQVIADRDAVALRELQVVHAQTLDQMRQLEAMYNQRNAEVAATSHTLETTTAMYNRVRAELEAAVNENAQLKEKIWNGEKERRYLHNQVMELKGNIRVFCRVRPILSTEFGVVTKLQAISFPANDDKKLEIWKDTQLQTPARGVKGAAVSGQIVTQTFEFDKVFGPESKQLEVFEEIAQLVQSAIDGYNVCVFAYGQTGSGKTFTMEGPPANIAAPERYGMIELSARSLFESINNYALDGWEYKVEASFVEIYMETVLDLLTKDPSKVNEKLDIRMVEGGAPNDVDVAKLTTVEVSSVDELKPLLQIAQRNRAVAATKCNDRSSRSHSIFRLRLSGVNPLRGVTSDGLINLVDLAGSENLKKSESAGLQFEEGKKINLSLLTLTKVITSLNNSERYIPYRESKLTYLLQNSIGGNSKTLMFVNINPEMDSIPESLNSLRFATQVNQCHVGTAVKNAAKKAK